MSKVWCQHRKPRLLSKLWRAFNSWVRELWYNLEILGEYKILPQLRHKVTEDWRNGI